MTSDRSASADDDPFNLARFVAAQEAVYATALAELRAGAKRTHWIWFIFPQLRGLGHSPMSHRYGIADLAEARDYQAHPLLGARLLACADATLSHPDIPAEAIFGAVDAGKLRSSATLFAAVEGAPAAFDAILRAFFGGRPCRLTLDRIGAAP